MGFRLVLAATIGAAAIGGCAATTTSLPDSFGAVASQRAAQQASSEASSPLRINLSDSGITPLVSRYPRFAKPALKPGLRESWVKKSECGKSVIYSADYVLDTIDIFPQGNTDHGPCGQLAPRRSRLATPQGLFVDNRGHLWVANSYEHEILEFAPLSSKVLRTLYDTFGEPVGVVVDSNTGTVYVSNLLGHRNGPGGVIAYDGGSNTPTRQLADTTLTNGYFITIDTQSNVYATLVDTNGFGAVHEWLGGTGNALDLGIRLSFPGGIETTRTGSLLICDQGIHACGDVLPGTTTLTNLFATTAQDPVNATLDRSEDTAIVPDTLVSIIDGWHHPGPDNQPLYEKTVGIPVTLFLVASPAAPIGVPFSSGSRSHGGATLQ